MYILRYAVCLFAIFNLMGCFCTGFRQIKTPEGTFACPKCCPLVIYSGTTVSVKGVDIGIPKNPVKIGEVTVEPKTIQTACDIVQILDQRRVATCELLPSYATISKLKFSEAVDAMREKGEILAQFALVVASKDGAAIQKFVEYYGPQVQRLQAGAEFSTKEITVASSTGFEEPSDGIKVVPLKQLMQ
jgi:hypothetical protein